MEGVSYRAYYHSPATSPVALDHTPGRADAGFRRICAQPCQGVKRPGLMLTRLFPALRDHRDDTSCEALTGLHLSNHSLPHGYRTA